MGRSLRASVPLGLLCLALVVIGALEYRWTDQLAGAEEQRLRAAMAAAGARFADDPGREIGRLMLALRPVPWTRGRDEAAGPSPQSGRRRRNVAPVGLRADRNPESAPA